MNFNLCVAGLCSDSHIYGKRWNKTAKCSTKAVNCSDFMMLILRVKTFCSLLPGWVNPHIQVIWVTQFSLDYVGNQIEQQPTCLATPTKTHHLIAS